mgnify:CR=1 FL=1
MKSTLLRLLALVCALPALAQEQKLDSELLQAGETDERVRVQILLANPPHPEVMGRIRRSAQARVEAASAALKRLDVARASRQDYEAASRQVDAIELEIRRQGTAAFALDAGPTSGKKVIEAQGLTKAYGDKLLFDGLDFKLPPGGIDVFEIGRAHV